MRRGATSCVCTRGAQGVLFPRTRAAGPAVYARSMRATTLLLLALLQVAVAVAAPLPEPARAEVMAVLDRLAASGCRFERNGTWYSAAEAREHLLTKLAQAERRASLRTAEAFIDRAASASSVSGRAYRVRCGDGAPIESRPWLHRQLQEVRASAGGGAQGPPGAR